MTTSCSKTNTVTNTIVDTVLVRSVDTVLPMNAKSWNYFGYQTKSLLDTGVSHYFTTNEGVRFIGQAYRIGGRLQTKIEFGINNKVVYYKWKAHGASLFAGYAPQVKYDAMYDDSTPALQGVDLGVYTVNGTVTGSIAIQDDTWYYTRVVPITGTDDYQVITSTNNYNNLGGNIVSSKTMPIYTKSGYISIRIGDCYGSTNSYGVLGECKIASN